jgi:hypothetical protein
MMFSQSKVWCEQALKVRVLENTGNRLIIWPAETMQEPNAAVADRSLAL